MGSSRLRYKKRRGNEESRCSFHSKGIILSSPSLATSNTWDDGNFLLGDTTSDRGGPVLVSSTCSSSSTTWYMYEFYYSVRFCDLLVPSLALCDLFDGGLAVLDDCPKCC